MVKIFSYAFSILSLFLSSCATMNETNMKPLETVNNVDLERYIGQWYEIARLDHRFERGLENVTATYSLREDGGLVVQNRGYSTKKNKWQDATGKAYFVGDSNVGHLKVSFFGPIYGSYAVFELDKEDYQYAFISGSNTKYLWFLSRTPTVSNAVMERFKSQATELGFDLTELIMVDQSPKS